MVDIDCNSPASLTSGLHLQPMAYKRAHIEPSWHCYFPVVDCRFIFCIILKAGVFEVLLLRLSVLFDPDNKKMTLLDGSVYRRDVCYAANSLHHNGQGHFLVDSLFDFVDRFNSLGLNDADLAFFCAFVLISPGRDFVHR